MAVRRRSPLRAHAGQDVAGKAQGEDQVHNQMERVEEAQLGLHKAQQEAARPYENGQESGAHQQRHLIGAATAAAPPVRPFWIMMMILVHVLTGRLQLGHMTVPHRLECQCHITVLVVSGSQSDGSRCPPPEATRAAAAAGASETGDHFGQPLSYDGQVEEEEWDADDGISRGEAPGENRGRRVVAVA